MEVLTSSQLTYNESLSALKVLQVVSSSSNAVQINVESVKSLIPTVSSIMQQWSSEEQSPSLVENKLLLQEQVEKILTRVNINENYSSVEFGSANINIKVLNYQRNKSEERDITYTPAVYVNSTDGWVATNPMTFTVLSSALELVSADAKIRLDFIFYSNSTIYPSNLNITKVAVVKLRNKQRSKLSLPIQIQYNDLKGFNERENLPETLYDRLTKLECMKWDRRSWVSSGCQLGIKQGSPTCFCHKFADFGLLFDSTVVPSQFVLSIFGKIGCGVSVFGCIATIAVYVTVKSLRAKKPTPYLVNICISLLVGYSVFLFGVQQTGDNNVCHFITALMQFSFLSSWLWMTVYSCVIYKALGQDFGRFIVLKWYHTIVVYSLALLVVLLNAFSTIFGVDGKLDQNDVFFISSYRLPNMCWLRKFSLYFGFLAPVGLMLVVNIGCFIVVLRAISCNASKIRSTAKRTDLADLLGRAVTMATLMGLTWLFGYLMLVADDVKYKEVVAWLFTLLNSTQGLAIFIVNCLRLKSIRQLWLKPIYEMSPFVSTAKYNVSEARSLQSRNTVSTEI